MLFLAVTLGFFADNIRDSFTNKAQEKEYILSMIEDVVKDKENIQKVIYNNTKRIQILDSLSDLCLNYTSENDSINKKMYTFYTAVLLRPDFLTPSELTMQQLKNAGGMRLIKSKKAINEIIRYDLDEKRLVNQQNYYENYQNKTISLGFKIFNLNTFRIAKKANTKQEKPNFTLNDFEFLNNDPILLKEFGNHTYLYSGIVEYYNMLLENMDSQADTLISTLQKEYKIDTK